MTELMLVQQAGQSSIYEIRLSLKALRKLILKSEIVTVYLIFGWLIGIFFAYGEALKVYFYNWMKRKKKQLN